MFGKKEIRNQEPSPYATRADFCRIFEKNIDRLYLLSFLLTGDRTLAEQCFVGGLHLAQGENQVFKEWAESWARRAIILNAIRVVRPGTVGTETIGKGTIGAGTTSGDTPAAPGRSAGQAATEPAEMAEIVELPAFDRFAFVMSVLERYSDQECSLLLGCTRGEVADARTRALRQIGRSAEVRQAGVPRTEVHQAEVHQEFARTRRRSLQDDARSALELDVFPHPAVA